MINAHPTLPEFEYIKPETLREASHFLALHNDQARPLLGGTDIFVRLRDGVWKDKFLVDVKSLEGMHMLSYDPSNGLMIGAAVNMNQVIAFPAVQELYPVLAQAAHSVASYQLRTRATIVGNLCNASPAADTAPALISLGGQARIAGLNGERVVPLEGFFSGPGRSVLRDDEILTGIQVPNPLPHTGGAYLKLSPREKDLATVAVAALITLNSEGTICEDARVVLGAVAPTVIRAFKAEEALMGKTVAEAVIRESAQKASEESQPITDIRGSAEYRKEMVAVQARRAIKRALELAKSV